jgi:hypothetical protein
MIHSKYRRNVWFRPFLDSNLGAASSFFRLFLWHAALQLFQAVLVYFRQSVASLTSLLLPLHVNSGKIYSNPQSP